MSRGVHTSESLGSLYEDVFKISYYHMTITTKAPAAASALPGLGASSSHDTLALSCSLPSWLSVVHSLPPNLIIPKARQKPLSACVVLKFLCSSSEVSLNHAFSERTPKTPEWYSREEKAFLHPSCPLHPQSVLSCVTASALQCFRPPPPSTTRSTCKTVPEGHLQPVYFGL